MYRTSSRRFPQRDQRDVGLNGPLSVTVMPQKKKAVSHVKKTDSRVGVQRGAGRASWTRGQMLGWTDWTDRRAEVPFAPLNT